MKPLSLIFCIALFCSCSNTKQENTQKADSVAVATTNVSTDGDFCFLFAERQDSTIVTLNISGNTVKGTMAWQPHEKDGAIGTLSGIKNATGELDLLYEYVIEGSHQTETKIMKIEGDKLLIKIGELEDPKYDGNLRYKDASKAVYTEILAKVACSE